MNDQDLSVEDVWAASDGMGDLAQLVVGAVAGKTLKELAKETGLSISTVQRRLSVPAVRTAIKEMRERRASEMLSQHLALIDPARDRLAGLVEHEDPSIALRAISLVFGHAIKLATAVDHEERLISVEAVVADVQSALDELAKDAPTMGVGP